jgi:hypothetical protein
MHTGFTTRFLTQRFLPDYKITAVFMRLHVYNYQFILANSRNFKSQSQIPTKHVY